MSAQAVPGTILKHFKGGRYIVLHNATDSANGEKVVVYVALKDGQIWVRPEKEFTERVAWRDGIYRARFIVDDPTG